MSKIAVVYWSGTGNTEIMANKIAEGVLGKGGQVDVFRVDKFDLGSVSEYDGFALGCPSMGAEVLEEDEFQPFWDNIKGLLGDKKVVLFGSYGWGDGEWMETWKSEIDNVLSTLILNETPDSDGEADCIALADYLV